MGQGGWCSEVPSAVPLAEGSVAQLRGTASGTPKGRQAACWAARWAAPGLTLLALQAMWDFPHTTCAIPADYLLDLIPRIRPRAFSIASSMLVRAQPFWPRFRL